MRTFAVAVAIVALSWGVDRMAVTPLDAATQVADIIAHAREALGGGSKLGEVHTLTAEGPFRRALGGREMEGTLELTLQRPDKMRRIEDISMSGMRGGPSVERIVTLNGDRAWDESNQRGGGGGMMVFRPGGPGGPGGEAPDPEEVERRLGRMMQGELQRWMFAFLVSSDREITHVGTAESPDGTAEVLEISDERGQPVRLFLDQATHLPLMLTYETVRPRVMMGGPGGPGGPGGRGMGRGQGGRSDPAEMRRRMEEERQRLEAEGPPPPVTAALHLSDYKAVSGILLPHRIEQSIAGEPSEEWTITRFRINPNVRADTFQKK